MTDNPMPVEDEKVAAAVTDGNSASADVQQATLAILMSIDGKLDKLPDYPGLLDVERQERKKGERLLVGLLVGLLVLIMAVGGLAWKSNQDRTHASHESRCGIRLAVASVVAVAEQGTPDDSPGRVVGRRIIARINHDLPADCGG